MSNFRKFFITLLVGVLAVSTVEAKLLTFGIKAGMNANELHFNKDILAEINKSNSFGWTAGVMVEANVPIAGLGLDLSVMYARMNNAADVYYKSTDPTQPEVAVENNLYGKNFIEIPLHVKYKLGLPVVGKYLKPMVFTGPNFAFRLDKSVQDAIQNIKSRNFQFAWNVGLGLEFFNHLQLSASYSIGCNDIVEKLHVDQALNATMDNSKVKNNYWTVTAAYLF